MDKLIKALAILACIGILLVVLAGAIVTKTGSGEGCGANWPLCHDQLIPTNPTIDTVIEYTHRLVTGVVGMLVISFSIWAGIRYRKWSEVMIVAISSIFFILLQSALGALAVLYGQSSAVLALHFGFSLLSLATVFLLAIYVFQIEANNRLPLPQLHSALKLGSMLLFIYTYVVIYLGALVRHTGSSLGCQDWPLCQGELIPSLSGQTGIHFLHRLAALGLLLACVWFFFHVKKRYQRDLLLSRSAAALLVLVSLQAASGGWVVLSGLAIIPALIHALIISFFFAILCHTLLYIHRVKG